MRRRATKAELQERVDRRCALVSAMGALRRLRAEEPADALARLGRAAVQHPEESGPPTLAGTTSTRPMTFPLRHAADTPRREGSDS